LARARSQVPKKAKEAKVKEHYSDDCKGTPVIEYQDSEGKHRYCLVCGFFGMEIRASNCSLSVEDYSNKIKEALRQLGINLDETR
jgi:hypothetical protein